MSDLAWLRLQIDWGADEALQELPRDHRQTREAKLSRPAIATAAATPPAQPPPAHTAPPAVVPAAAVPPVQARAEEAAAAATTLEELRAAIAAFDGIAQRETAMNLVFSDGTYGTGLMLIGEGPGDEEDRQGKPFVGRSGQLLDRMLASIGLDRSRLVITNLVNWRPLGNQTPDDRLVALSLPFLRRHIALARPRHLLLLGKTPFAALSGSREGITRARGRWYDIVIPGLDTPVPGLATLHPAYLLRTPSAKRHAWSDLLLLRRVLEADGFEFGDNRVAQPIEHR